MASSIFVLNGGVLTVGAQSLFPDGTNGLPSIAFLNDPTTGFFRVASGNIQFVPAASSSGVLFGLNALNLGSGGRFGWSSSTSPGAASADTLVSRIAAGVPGSNLVGGGTQTGGFPVSIFTSTTSASNASTTETDLISYSLPANTLSVNGQKVRITTWVNTAANVNSKDIRIYFGATQVIARNAEVTSANRGTYQAYVIRTGATSQVADGWYSLRNGAVEHTFSTPAETLSGAVTIKVTGQSAVAGGDVTAVAMFIEWIP